LSLASHLVSAQEDERRRISLELHDEAGQALTALKLNLAMLQDELPGELDHTRSKIREAIALTEKTMGDLRSLAYNLRPPAIDAVGLSQTLQDYCQRVARQAGIQVIYKDRLRLDLPSYFQLSIYRVVQEALTNIVKHACATRVEVRLENDAEQIVVSVADNGRGFSAQASSLQVSKGLGLIGIQERMEALGGVFEITSQNGGGTELTARIPIQEGM
jgi:signal transduction histidine kinase